MALEYQICTDATALDIEFNRMVKEACMGKQGIVSVNETKLFEFPDFDQCINLRIDKFNSNEQGMLWGSYNAYKIASDFCEQLDYNISLVFNYEVEMVKKTSEGIIFPSDKEWALNHLVKPYGFFKNI